MKDGNSIKPCHDYKQLGMKNSNNEMFDKVFKERKATMLLISRIQVEPNNKKINEFVIYDIIIKSVTLYSDKISNPLRATEMEQWTRAARRLNWKE